MYKCAKFDQNIWCGSTVMRIFTSDSSEFSLKTLTNQNDTWQSIVTILHTSVSDWTMLKLIGMLNLMQRSIKTTTHTKQQQKSERF